MVANRPISVVALEIARCLTGYLSWSDRYVENLELAMSDKQQETLRMWLSTARAFAKWHSERAARTHSEMGGGTLRTVLSEYFLSRGHLQESSIKSRFFIVKTLFSLHPDVYGVFTDRDWSSVKQDVWEISRRTGVPYKRTAVQPILRRHLYSFAGNVASTIRTEPWRRQHLVCLRALGAVAHTAMLRVPALSELRIRNIEEIVTNTVSRLQWDKEVNGLLAGEEWRRHLPMLALRELFDPPIGSVTCSVSVPKKGADWIIRLGSEMTSWVLDWLDSRAPYDENSLLFYTRGVTYHEKPLTPASACNLFREIVQIAGNADRHITRSSMFFGAVVDYLRKGLDYHDLAERTQINGKGLSVQRIEKIDHQIRAHSGAIDDLIIEV